jgi:hypothetical protein
MDPYNFYEIEIDSDGSYPRGAMRVHDGTTYMGAAGDVIFRCLGAVDTARQVQQIVNRSGISALASVMLEAPSGIEGWQYRGSDETVLSVVLSLLEQGTASGARLLAAVVRGGLTRVFNQPLSWQRLWVWKDKTLWAASGTPAQEGWLPVGEWVHLDDMLLTGVWSGLSPLFIEGASYQVGSGWSLDAENQQGLGGLLGVLQG